ncbi:MAG: hypothetical protein Q4G05_00970 [Clostridia bacterium]|nr:hypothetical protein [Clostridia bacterium]
MENSSKALIIAGEVLIGMLILGLLVFSYTKLSSSKAVQLSEEQIVQIVEFNKSFESYNRKNLYGNDIISVINKIDDYNKKEADVQGDKAYKPIDLSIVIKNEIIGTEHFKNKKYNFKSISKSYNELKNWIDAILKRKYNGRDVSYYSGLTTQQYNEELSQIEAMGVHINKSELDKDIEEYNNYSRVLKEFKKKKFECTNVKYDNLTKRMELLEFSEQ